MKRFLLVVIALFAINTMVQAQSHKVGDIVVIGNEVGVVFFVTPDGQHGKVMSTSEIKSTWNVACVWCSQLGIGWRLPSQSDFGAILGKKYQLNSVLLANGYEAIRNEYYWSADAFSDIYAWGVSMLDGSTNDGNNKSHNLYVRAVSAF
jgi:hypothetical protein